MKGGQSAAHSGGGQDLEDTKRQLEEARERHFHLRSRCDDLEDKCSQMVGLCVHVGKNYDLDSTRILLTTQVSVFLDKTLYGDYLCLMASNKL